MLPRNPQAVTRITGVILPIGVAALLIPFRATFASTAAALVLVAVVVGVSAPGDRVSGYLATVSSTLSFDVFLTQPYGRLAISHRPDLETAICLFVVGIAVTELSVRSRHHRETATEEAEHLSVLHSVSELVASGASEEEVARTVRDYLVGLLHLRSCQYTTKPSERPRFHIEDSGNVFLAGRLWAVNAMGLPGPEIELPVKVEGHAMARFVLGPTPGWPVSRERRLVAVALADQVGASLRPHLRSA
jgi:K+-sensing histidine kinase KdpD